MATAPTPGASKALTELKPILLTRGDEQRTFRIADVSGLVAHELMMQTKVYTPKNLVVGVASAYAQDDFSFIDLNTAAALWWLAGMVIHGVGYETWADVAGGWTYSEDFTFAFEVDPEPDPEVVREVDAYTPLSDSGET